jgi:hypothetical protein
LSASNRAATGDSQARPGVEQSAESLITTTPWVIAQGVVAGPLANRAGGVIALVAWAQNTLETKTGHAVLPK